MHAVIWSATRRTWRLGRAVVAAAASVTLPLARLTRTRPNPSTTPLENMPLSQHGSAGPIKVRGDRPGPVHRSNLPVPLAPPFLNPTPSPTSTHTQSAGDAAAASKKLSPPPASEGEAHTAPDPYVVV